MREKTWIVVAESSRARLFARNGSKLDEIETLVHPQGRVRNRDLDSDRPGRTFDSAGPGRHAMNRHNDPKRTEAMNFARQIVERLESARTRGSFTRLVLIAAPEFLGLLRQDMSAPLAGLVTRSIDKNLVQADAGEILEHLAPP